MIVADLKNIGRHIPSDNALKKAVEFLLQLAPDAPALDALEDGRMDIDGQNMFAIIRRYETSAADAPVFEYHRKYIDVQYVASGEEIIGWAPAAGITVTREYDEEKDVCMGAAPVGRISDIYLQAGRVAVFFPEDGHAPGLAAGAPSRVCKVVVKVAAA